jgi:hypothetical protein
MLEPARLEPFVGTHLVRVLALPTNILAYYDTATITAVKTFIIQAHALKRHLRGER